MPSSRDPFPPSNQMAIETQKLQLPHPPVTRPARLDPFGSQLRRGACAATPCWCKVIAFIHSLLNLRTPIAQWWKKGTFFGVGICFWLRKPGIMRKSCPALRYKLYIYIYTHIRSSFMCGHPENMGGTNMASFLFGFPFNLPKASKRGGAPSKK